MNNRDYLVDLDEQTEFLKSLKGKNLENWLTLALRDWPEPFGPLFELGETEIEVQVVHIFRAGGPALEHRIRKAITKLINSWTRDLGFEYLDKLIYIAGRLKIIENYRFFLKCLRQHKFVDVFISEHHRAHGEDLHLSLLRAIGDDWHQSEGSLAGICRRDIEYQLHPEYFAVCYRILYEMDFNNLIKYFYKLLQYCIKGYFSFKSEFSQINHYWGNEFFDSFQTFYYLPELRKFERYFFMVSLYNILHNDKKQWMGGLLIDSLINDNISYHLNKLENTLDDVIIHNRPEHLKSMLSEIATSLSNILDDDPKQSFNEIDTIHRYLLCFNGYSEIGPYCEASLENIIILLHSFLDIINLYNEPKIIEANNLIKTGRYNKREYHQIILNQLTS